MHFLDEGVIRRFPQLIGKKACFSLVFMALAEETWPLFASKNPRYARDGTIKIVQTETSSCRAMKPIWQIRMRLLLGLAAIWFLITLLVGALGASVLDAMLRATENRSMVGCSALMASICSDEQWQYPWQSDPRWVDLEERWDVDIVPIYADSLHGVSPPLSRREDESIDANVWTLVNTGTWRISRLVAIPPRALPQQAQQIIGVQVTRVTDFSRVSRIWWTLWAATCGLGCCVVAFTAYTLRQHSKRKRDALQPWVNATREITNSEVARLPESLPGDEDLAVQLAIMRESVNRWLSELQSIVQRSELVLGNMQEGVLAVDDKSRVLLANAAVVRLIGISMETYLYRSLVEVIRTPRVVAIIERVLESSTPQEESFEHGNQQLSLRVLVRPIQLGNDRVGALMTVRDETLLKRIESVRRDFVTNASHELKTPLAAIRAYAETLQMGAIEDAEATQTFIVGILSQADRINGLINGMLQLARVQVGGAMLKRVHFEVRSEIESSIDAAEVMARAKQVTLTTELPATPLFMHSDPEAVQTVVSNLLSNAVRYTPAGGNVNLRLTTVGTGLTIRVEDTGIGIDKEELARIFERFYRVESARTAETGGTGLGLSIVKHILHALDGTVTVTSQPNIGSCFEVYLPIEPA